MSKPREVLLNYQTKSESDRIPLILTYHPYNLITLITVLDDETRCWLNMHARLVVVLLTDLDIEQCRIRPLQLDHPCHKQCVERHVKMVTEAAAQVKGFERRDGLIRQKIKSRKLLKKFDTKVQF